MTRYEQGFITKCAEYGVDGRRLLKRAQVTQGKLIGTGAGLGAGAGFVPGALLGAGIGALVNKKKRLRGALYGALIGGGSGALLGGGLGALAGRSGWKLYQAEEAMRAAAEEAHRRNLAAMIRKDPAAALAPQRAEIQAAKTPEERASIEQRVATTPVVREALMDGSLTGGEYADSLGLTPDYDGGVRDRNAMGLGGYFANMYGNNGQ